MATTISGRNAASKKTMHATITPPCISNIPPMTPPKPDGVPAPFPYSGRAATGGNTVSKLKIKGGEALAVGASVDCDPPANMPSQPAPLHDLVTMQVKNKLWLP